VERENPGGDPLGIKAVADSVRAERGDEDVNRVDRFAPAGGQDDVSPGSDQRDHQPERGFQEFVHTRCSHRTVFQRRIVWMIGVSRAGSTFKARKKARVAQLGTSTKPLINSLSPRRRSGERVRERGFQLAAPIRWKVPLSPALSPLVPRREREREAFHKWWSYPDAPGAWLPRN